MSTIIWQAAPMMKQQSRPHPQLIHSYAVAEEADMHSGAEVRPEP